MVLQKLTKGGEFTTWRSGRSSPVAPSVNSSLGSTASSATVAAYRPQAAASIPYVPRPKSPDPPTPRRTRRNIHDTVATSARSEDEHARFSIAATNPAYGTHPPALPPTVEQPVSMRAKKATPVALKPPMSCTQPQTQIQPTRGKKRAREPEVPPTHIASGSTMRAISGSAITQPPPAKKGRKTAAPKAAQEEKRLARFKQSCPQNILDRVDRVMSQRFFMVDRQRQGTQLKEEFKVLGSTGNIYTVMIDKLPSCDCPDARKGNHCKHILFIFLKVLQIPLTSSVWYQKALLTSELEYIFAHAPLAPNSVSHPRIQEAYARATGKAPSAAAATAAAAAAAKTKKRALGPEDDCPICYDAMQGVGEAGLVHCEECGNAVHTECFKQWQNTARSTSQPLTCVWCRAKWTIIGAPAATGYGAGGRSSAGGAGVTTSGGYMNLSGAAGLSPVRDTSSYYSGPRRGQRRFRYTDYEDGYEDEF